MSTGEGAEDRLTPALRAGLANIAASWQLEQADLSPAAQEILAAYLLHEITGEECDVRLDSLR